jgi:hypothetical protein
MHRQHVLHDCNHTLLVSVSCCCRCCGGNSKEATSLLSDCLPCLVAVDAAVAACLPALSHLFRSTLRAVLRTHSLPSSTCNSSSSSSSKQHTLASESDSGTCQSTVLVLPCLRNDAASPLLPLAEQELLFTRYANVCKPSAPGSRTHRKATQL